MATARINFVSFALLLLNEFFNYVEKWMVDILSHGRNSIVYQYVCHVTVR
jgi:hypothetical protein